MKNGQTAWPARFPHSIKFWSVLCDFFARFRVVEEFRVAFEVVNDLGDGRVSVVFEQPQRAVTPGQSVVFYADEVCLGGAVIEETF